jgi:anti-sigma factor RsiW
MPDTRDPHSQAEELLPWYATGQLDAADRSLVETHLTACARCQRQLAGERRMVEQFQSFSPEVDSGWARIRQRIEAPAGTRPGWIARTAADVWQMLKRPAVAALATAQVVLLAIAAAILPSLGTGPAYVALGDRAQPAASAAASANVIILFRPEATEAGMRSALRQSGASLVGGPTDADAYLLNVPEAQRPTALARLRADREVLMAEPIDGAVQ